MKNRMTMDEIGKIVGDESFAEYLKSRIVDFGVEYHYDKKLRRKVLVLFVPKDTELDEEQIKLKYECLSKIVQDAVMRNVLIRIVPSELRQIHKMACYVGNPDNVSFILNSLKELGRL